MVQHLNHKDLWNLELGFNGRVRYCILGQRIAGWVVQ